MNPRFAGRSIRWMLAAAIAGPAVALLGSAAQAQYAVTNNQGNALDSNNRVGSNGKHENLVPNNRGSVGVTSNQIFYGNVTNFKEFRGPTGSFDAREFHGNTATSTSDTFIRRSAGGFDTGTLAQQYETKPFYGNSRAVAAPANYSSTITTGGNVYNQTNQGLTTIGQPLNAATLATLNTGEGLIPKLGSNVSVIGGGSVDARGASNSFIVLSPLGGIRQVSSDQLGSYTVRGTVNGGGFRTSSGFLDKVRSESGDPFNSAATPGGDQSAPGSLQPGTLQSPGSISGAPAAPIPGGPQPLNKPMQAPVESPGSSSIGATPLGTTPTGPTSGQPLPSGTGTGESIRRQYTVPTTPNKQYSELEKRLQDAQAGDQPVSDQQAAQQFRMSKPVQPGSPPNAAPGTPGTPKPGTPTTPGTPAIPGTPAVPNAGGAAKKVEPLVIKSLAEGVKSPTLADKLREAESDMKQGKFADALDKYALAEQASPNDPLIYLGRANAELGAGTYRTAEMHLRDAFAGNQALLMGKYDLNTLIGQERVNTLTADLKTLSAKEPQETMAPFLLAYISYNTGNEAEAAAQLTEVEKREGGSADPVVKLLRQRWSLTGNLNK